MYLLCIISGSLFCKLCITCLEVRINCRQFLKKVIHVINVSGLNLAENILLLLYRELLNVFNLLDEMDIKFHCQLKDKPERHDVFPFTEPCDWFKKLVSRVPANQSQGIVFSANRLQKIIIGCLGVDGSCKISSVFPSLLLKWLFTAPAWCYD